MVLKLSEFTRPFTRSLEVHLVKTYVIAPTNADYIIILLKKPIQWRGELRT